mmetsp:Transcript_38954/g.70741  ORF Transcript_38954/g.70741 Transcript_38954/m.70741 type:complete len:100 (+) Transcript_38954:1078-1377(+)
MTMNFIRMVFMVPLMSIANIRGASIPIPAAELPPSAIVLVLQASSMMRPGEGNFSRNSSCYGEGEMKKADRWDGRNPPSGQDCRPATVNHARTVRRSCA